MGENIDWDDMLGGNFVKLETGVPKKLKVANWRTQTAFKEEKTGELKPGICFEALEEDGKPCKEGKTWTTTSIRALQKLRPLLEKAATDGKKEMVLNIVRVGEGKATQYDISGQ